MGRGGAHVYDGTHFCFYRGQQSSALVVEKAEEARRPHQRSGVVSQIRFFVSLAASPLIRRAYLLSRVSYPCCAFGFVREVPRVFFLQVIDWSDRTH
jgi:hypothetical protein